MLKPYIILAIAGISAFVALQAFYMPWIRYDTGPKFFDLGEYVDTPAQDPPADARLGLEMAANSGRVTYGTLDELDDNRDYIHFEGTAYLLDLPIAGGIGTALAALKLLRRRTLPGAYTAWFYIIAGGMCLTMLTMNTVNLYRSEIVSGLLIRDVYDMRLLYGFWLSALSFAIMFLAGTGLWILARQQAPRPKRSRI